MIRIITTKRLEELEETASLMAALRSCNYDMIGGMVKNVQREANRKGTTLNCGAKSCQFTTTSAKGLAIHRGKAHK